MRLELILGDKEEDDEMDRLTVKGLKIDPGFGTAEASRHFGDGVAAGMRNGNAEPDTGAHGLLAMTQGANRLLPIGDIELTFLDQASDDLLDGLPLVGGDHLRNDLTLGE